MALVKIRGEQVKSLAFDNSHIKADAAIAESKLNVAWSTHYQNARTEKKVVDFIQVNDLTVTAAAPTNVDLTGIITGDPTPVDSASTDEGVIIDAPKNKCIVRDGISGEPILEGTSEVYGRVTHDTTKFVLNLYSGEDVPYAPAADVVIDFQYTQRFNLDTVSEMFAANEKFVENAADATSHLNIEQLAKDIYGAGYALDRDGNANLGTSLSDQVDNEVSRAQGVESTLQDNIDAEATRATGAETTLQGNIDAEATRATGAETTLQGNIDAEATRATGAETTLQGNIDAEVTARTNADQAIRDDLVAADTATKGANLVGVEDAAANFTATTVEGVLAELKTAVDNAASSSTAELDTYKADLASQETNKGASLVGIEDAAAQYTATTVEGALAEVYDKVELEITDRAAADQAIVDDLASVVTSKGASLVGVEDSAAKFAAGTVEGVLAELQTNIETEASDRATAVSAEESARIAADSALDTRVTNLEAYDHEHKKQVHQIATESTVVTLTGGETLVSGTEDVYVNGLIQANGIHYTVVESVPASGNFDTIDFDPDTVVSGDVVIIKWVKSL